MKLCFLGIHKNRLMVAKKYMDTSCGGRAEATELYLSCEHCGRPETEIILGWWNLKKGMLIPDLLISNQRREK